MDLAEGAEGKTDVGYSYIEEEDEEDDNIHYAQISEDETEDEESSDDGSIKGVEQIPGIKKRVLMANLKEEPWDIEYFKF